MKTIGSSAPASVTTAACLPRQHYVAELRNQLAPELFLPVPHRLLWMAFYYAVVAASAVAIWLVPNLLFRFVAAVVWGHCLGVLGFLGHEILHGSVIRNRTLMELLGGICMAHWGIHPRAWIAWHNRLHHQQTNHGFADPDCFGPEQLYNHSRFLKVLEKFTPGSGTRRSSLFLFFWFSFHAIWVAWMTPNLFRKRYDRYLVRTYVFGIQIVWVAVAVALMGLSGFVFLWLIPVAVSNFVMMSYVATNHFISPLTEEINDPLINSLTVRSNWLIETFHLNNNYHVEHHVMPYVNPVHAPVVAAKLKELWPDKYQEMSHFQALKRVYASPRFYESDIVLVNPRTRFTAKTLLAHYLEMD
jgi:fatty acid desaturase